MKCEAYYIVSFPKNMEPIDENVYEYQGKPLTKIFFSNIDIAEAEASRLARLNPGNLVHILKTIGVREAVSPVVIDKMFNEEGELVNV